MATVEQTKKIETTIKHEISFKDIDELVRKHYKIPNNAEVSYHRNVDFERTPDQEDTVLIYKKTTTEYK